SKAVVGEDRGHEKEIGMSSANDAASASQASGVMERGGFYNRHSLPQHDAAAFGMDDLAAAAASVPLAAPGRVFVIADYGAAQGRNSLAPMRSTIEKLRSRAAAPMPIAVVHTDIPGNDFSALFELLDRSGESYLAGVENVFAYAAGRTFYR